MLHSALLRSALLRLALQGGADDAPFSFLRGRACECCVVAVEEDAEDEVFAADEATTVEVDAVLETCVDGLATTHVFDSHCHTHVVADGAAEDLYFGVVQATRESEWEAVLSLCGRRKGL